MAMLIQATCLMFLLGMVSTWPFPVLFERRLPVAYIHTSFEEGSSASSPSSLLNEINKIMSVMHERFEHMMGRPTLSHDMYDDNDYDLLDGENQFNPMENFMTEGHNVQVVDELTDIQTRLDAVVPFCTTVTDSPTTISPRKSRRKKLPSTHTTTCIRELIVNGQKHISEEISTTDDKGALIKHNKSYGMVLAGTDQHRPIDFTDYEN